MGKWEKMKGSPFGRLRLRRLRWQPSDTASDTREAGEFAEFHEKRVAVGGVCP
jgi:hypothetical protein